jgi:hypothetical protein
MSVTRYYIKPECSLWRVESLRQEEKECKAKEFEKAAGVHTEKGQISLKKRIHCVRMPF